MRGKEDYNPVRAQRKRRPAPGNSRKSGQQRPGDGSDFHAESLVKVKGESEVAQSCLTLCDPMDCSPPGSSAHGIFQARVLEWGAIAFSVGVHSTLVSFLSSLG